MLLLSLLFCSHGCEGPLARLLPSQNDPAAREPNWGEAVQGLQCRFRADKQVWQSDEIPAFKLDIRNHGQRMFAFPPSHMQQICKIQFDGKWYHWPSPVMIDSSVWPLAPGLQFDDIPIMLHKEFGIKITPGRHIVRIAFALEGVEIVSNPVGIKVLPGGSKNG